MNCVVCQGPLDPALAPEISHPTCSATSFFDPLDGTDPFDLALKQQLLEVIRFADREDPRSKQVQVGPSEMGVGCDRRLAYRLAGLAEVNTAFDPWPATVGTAIHAWLERAMSLWNAQSATENWLTEQSINFDFGGVGHGDLYRVDPPTVIDWKSASKDVMTKVKKDGPPQKYIVQIHLYGYGYKQMGRPVDRVALAFVPRAGWIKDMYVWSQPYNEQIATDAINRMFRIARDAVGLDVIREPHRWQQLEAEPSDDCGTCPWYNPLRTAEQGASEQGCPGH